MSNAHKVKAHLNVLLGLFDISVTAVVLANDVSVEDFDRPRSALKATALLQFFLRVRNPEAFEGLARLNDADLVEEVFVLSFNVEVAEEVGELLLGVVDLDDVLAVAEFVNGLNVGESTAVGEVVVQVDLLEYDLARAALEGVAVVHGGGYLFKHLTDLFN